ncbi:hypothetical protein CgunFtcFv8_018644 [Champsocephalus gunnari]|uniref:Uncharacterized protein n=1 Tax=Champsocephalus gunnari TaxID=52237 RepID=A0AAN8BUJ8_CHAGU|nr:hypothetical protein CgunFtcFv8_018644 [Champsocephalus gunnari]
MQRLKLKMEWQSAGETERSFQSASMATGHESHSVCLQDPESLADREEPTPASPSPILTLLKRPHPC